jgi:hypothetical protein
MQLLADYGIVSDGQITLTTTAPDDFKQLPLFNLDKPDSGSRAILMFNALLQSVDGFAYNVKINGTEVFNATYFNHGFFTIHEVIPAGLIKATGNIIQFKALSSDSGSVKIGDVIIWYQHAV